MKKLLLASAVAALSITAAQAAPTVYGKAFLTLDLNDGDTDYTNVVTTTVNGTSTVATVNGSRSEEGRSKLNSNASRIGLKGSEALTQNTDLVYQLEYGVDIDEDSDQFKSRDTYLGLANNQYGTLVAGRLTAIDDYVNYANVTAGGVLGGDNVLASFDGPRANNTFAYFSPERNGLQLMGMYTLDENDDSDSLGRDAFGVGAKYEPANAAYKVGATYIQAGDALKAIRVSGAYAASPALTLGGLYQNADYDSDDNENAFTVSANYKVAQTPWTAYGQLDYVDNVEGAKDAEKQRIAIGGKYAFNKATTGHIYGAYMKTEGILDEATSVTTDKQTVRTTVRTVNTKNEFDGFGIGGGIEYKF